MNKSKTIFHIDLNQFYCSVAILQNPSLKGKAFAVGRENTLKGVVSTASYEARKYGVHSGMSLVDAFKKLPTLIVINHTFELYYDYSHRFFNLIRQYQPNIEQASIDEGYIDVTDITVNKGIHPVKLAKEIQKRALDELGLPCSIGIAPTLYLAKMASDMKKPLGITILRKRDIQKMLYPLPVSDIFGIGKKTWPRLISHDIKTIGDFMNPENKDKVIAIVGKRTYDHEFEALSGNSTNIVDKDRYSDPESISRSVTFDKKINNYNDALKEINYLLKDVYDSMIESKKKAKTVGIILRDTSFRTITRGKTLNEATIDYDLIKKEIEKLLDENYNDDLEYRLLGVSLSNLVDVYFTLPEEINLFNYEQYYGKEEKIREIIRKFGENKIKFGLDESD